MYGMYLYNTTDTEYVVSDVQTRCILITAGVAMGSMRLC
mgnify:CR=1 FL=1